MYISLQTSKQTSKYLQNCSQFSLYHFFKEINSILHISYCVYKFKKVYILQVNNCPDTCNIIYNIKDYSCFLGQSLHPYIFQCCLYSKNKRVSTINIVDIFPVLFLFLEQVLGEIMGGGGGGGVNILKLCGHSI